MDKRTTNALVAGTTTVSFFGSFLAGFFKLIGFIGTAMTVDEMFNFCQKWGINFFPIYLFIFFSGVFWFAQGLWGPTSRFLKKRKLAKQVNWDMPFKEAMQYLISYSCFGKAWPDSKVDFLSAEALKEAAKMGKLKIGGMLQGTYHTQHIPLSNKDIHILYRNSSISKEFLNVFIVDDKEKPIADNIFFDEKQVKKLWKSY